MKLYTSTWALRMDIKTTVLDWITHPSFMQQSQQEQSW